MQKPKQPIDDRLKRINYKSKRKKTLIKKAIEISQLCNLGIVLVIHDAEMNKVIQYNSGTSKNGLFTLDAARNALQEVQDKKKFYEFHTDEYNHRGLFSSNLNYQGIGNLFQGQTLAQATVQVPDIPTMVAMCPQLLIPSEQLPLTNFVNATQENIERIC